jgi:hypothetical protein
MAVLDGLAVNWQRADKKGEQIVPQAKGDRCDHKATPEPPLLAKPARDETV